MKMITKMFRTLLPAAAVLFGLMILVNPADAHTDGKLQLAATPAGPFQISVWTSPDPATTGELHVALSVVSAEDASPAFDAVVMVQLTSMENGPSLSAPATTEDSANKFLYEALLTPDTPGVYLVTIEISDNEVGNGEVSFELEIVDESGFDPLYLIPISLAVAAGALLILARRGKPGKIEDEPA